MAALFYQPYGVALDSSGNLYVADRGNDLIREITSAGVVTTFAGSAGVPGSTDATGTSARFSQPTGIAVDSGGNIYVADSANNTIRKITSGGVVTTLAGTAGKGGSTDTAAGSPLFNQPYGVAVDGSGNVYVVELGNNTIRKITSAGVVSTLAGTAGGSGDADGTGTSASFNQPIGIAWDGSGNLYVADSGNNTIREVTLAGVVTTLAGMAGVPGDADGIGTAARFKSPRGVAVDATGSIFVADSENCTVRMITPTGVVTTLAGTPGDFSDAEGAGATALFDVPIGIAADSTGNLYVSSELGYTVEKGSAAPISPPAITQQPASQTVAVGSNVTFSVVATGSPAPTFQWYLNGSAIAGAVNSDYTIPSALPANDGSYTVTVTSGSSTVTSSAAMLTVVTVTPTPTPTPSGGGRAVNLSARANVGTGGNILIAGFVIQGTGSKSVLLRGVGPTLGTTFNVSGSLAQPQLTLISSAQMTLATDTAWGGSVTLSNAFTQVGAFSLPAASADSAILTSVPAGAYTSQVAGINSTTGVALAEIYDADNGTPTANLVNISARANVSSGANVLIAGFVIQGGTAQLLLRGVGPTLGTTFNVPGSLAQPSIGLYDVSSTLIAGNTGWGNAVNPGTSTVSAMVRQATAADMIAVGAFSLPAGSADSAMVATVPAGNYTLELSGTNSANGVGLVEVYLMQ